jgi:hypothetical protein
MTDIFDLDLAATRRLILRFRAAGNVDALTGLAEMLAGRAATGAETAAQLDAAHKTLALRADPPDSPVDQLRHQAGITRRPIEATLVASRNQAYAEVDRLTGVLLAVVDALTSRHDYNPAGGIHHRACGACAVLAMVPDDIRSEALAAAARRALPPIPGEPA